MTVFLAIPSVAKNGKKQLCHMFWNKTASQKMREMRTWWNWTTTSRTLCKTSVLKSKIAILPQKLEHFLMLTVNRNKAKNCIGVYSSGAKEKLVKASTERLKITQNVAFQFLILAFSTIFCRIEIDLSGNTVWPQASDIQ